MSAEEDLRRLINEPSDNSKYNSEKLSAILQQHGGNSNKAAAQIWTEKAALYSQLVDMQEGDSKRNLSDLMKNAMKMADLFRAASQPGDDDSGVHQTTVGRITRA